MLQGLGGWLDPRVQTGIGAFVFFRLVYDYLNKKIETFGLELMGNMMAWASGIALVLVTLWVLVTGYRMLTGQLRESMMATTVRALQIVLIVGSATAMSALGSDLHRLFTHDLDQEIHGLFTGQDNQTAADAIDENLAYMQLALGAIDAVQVLDGSDEAREQKARALLFAGFGTASPPMAAGAMLLLFQFAIAIFVGLGPLFILCLIFEQTKDLFRKWLLYGLGTLFSMAMLSVVTAMAMELSARVAAALWGAKAIAAMIPGADPEGLSSQALQQGGIGLLLTVLIVSVPPMAAAFFQGTMGNFLTYTAFNPGASNQPGPQGQPPGAYAASAQTQNQVRTESPDRSNNLPGLSTGSRTMADSGRPQSDEIKKR